MLKRLSRAGLPPATRQGPAFPDEPSGLGNGGSQEQVSPQGTGISRAQASPTEDSHPAVGAKWPPNSEKPTELSGSAEAETQLQGAPPDPSAQQRVAAKSLGSRGHQAGRGQRQRAPRKDAADGGGSRRPGQRDRGARGLWPFAGNTTFVSRSQDRTSRGSCPSLLDKALCRVRGRLLWDFGEKCKVTSWSSWEGWL